MICLKRSVDRDLIVTSQREALRCIISNIEYRFYKDYGMEIEDKRTVYGECTYRLVPREDEPNVSRMLLGGDQMVFRESETVELKSIVVEDVKKGLRPEGVYVRQGYSSVPATNTIIRRMIKETDGDHFEEMRSLEQNLTFEAANKEFSERNVQFGQVQMKTLGIMSQDGVYTNLGLLLSDQCGHTIKTAVFEGTNQNEFKDRKELSGFLFKQMDEVYDFIDFRNQTHSIFEKLRRIDQRDYPEVAVRESLLNLLVHCEYSFRASQIRMQ